jgi:hypothetical protein
MGDPEASTLERRLWVVLIVGGATVLVTSLLAIVFLLVVAPGMGGNDECPPNTACLGPGGAPLDIGDAASRLEEIVEDPTAQIDPETIVELHRLLGIMEAISPPDTSDTAATVGLVVAIIGAVTGAVAAAAGVASAMAAYRTSGSGGRSMDTQLQRSIENKAGEGSTTGTSDWER